jgi:hypothetical protein
MFWRMFMPQRDFKLPLKAIVCNTASLFILLAVISAPAAQSNSLRGLYITGQYLYMGELPSEMEGLFSINLIANDSRGRNRPLTGDVAVSAKGKYRFMSARLYSDRLTFSTRTIQGISYEFEGRILKIRAPEGSFDIPELEGTLTKIRNGEKSGAVTGRFKYEEFGD